MTSMSQAQDPLPLPFMRVAYYRLDLTVEDFPACSKVGHESLKKRKKSIVEGGNYLRRIEIYLFRHMQPTTFIKSTQLNPIRLKIAVLHKSIHIKLSIYVF